MRLSEGNTPTWVGSNALDNAISSQLYRTEIYIARNYLFYMMTNQDLRAVVERLELSQADLAKLLEVTPRSVNLWATGQRAVPGPVAAYLRIFEMVPQPFRDAELARIRKEEPMLKEGMYEIAFSGTNDSGMGALILENGRVYGADLAGGKYDGDYEYNRLTGMIESKIKVTIPPGVGTVQGIPPQPFEFAFNVEAKFPRGTEDTIIQVKTDAGPVNVRIRFLRALPE